MVATTAVRTAATTVAFRPRSRRFSARESALEVEWSHEFVQAQVVGVLINQRKRYDSDLRRILADNQIVRDQADYRPELVTPTQASRALRRSRMLVNAVQRRGGVAQ